MPGRTSEELVNTVLQALRKLADKSTTRVDEEGRTVADIVFPPHIRSWERLVETVGLKSSQFNQCSPLLVQAGLFQAGRRGTHGASRWVEFGSEYRHIDATE